MWTIAFFLWTADGSHIDQQTWELLKSAPLYRSRNECMQGMMVDIERMQPAGTLAIPAPPWQPRESRPLVAAPGARAKPSKPLGGMTCIRFKMDDTDPN
jgi:hypothetical protein